MIWLTRMFGIMPKRVNNLQVTPFEMTGPAAAAKKSTEAYETPLELGGAVPASNTARKCRLVLIEDHPLFRHGLAKLINSQHDMTICGEAANAATGLNEVLRLKPDLVVVDITLNNSANGIEFIKNLRAQLPTTKVVVISMHDESVYAVRALRAGAKGYIMKKEPADRCVEGIRKVMAGDVHLSEKLRQQALVEFAQGTTGRGSVVDVLSDRELEIFQLCGRRLMPREIAEQLKISVKTVETHRSHVREKLKLEDGGELTRFAISWTEQNEAM